MQSLKYRSTRWPGIPAMVLALVYLSIPQVANAQTYAAMEDAYTKSKDASTNFGGRADVRTQKWAQITGFAKFNLDGIPSSSDIDSATLRITLRDVVLDSRVTIHRVLDSWGERSINHNNKPALSSQIASFSVNTSQSGRTISVDATDVARALASSGSNSIALVTTDGNVGISSRESGSPIALEVTPSSSGSGGGSGGGSSGNTELLPAVADAYTKAKDSTINFGSRADVRAQRWSDITGFAQFDLRQVDSNADADSATLHIPVRDVGVGGLVTVHRVLGNWNEGSITHSNKPSLSPALASFNVSQSNEGQTILIDASAVARELLQNRSNSYGIALVTSNGNVGMGSRESGSPIRLEIETTSGGSGGGNQPPTISGTPPSLVSANSTYDFRPQASDPDNTALSFSIDNRPAWANFSSGTGRLYGTPSLGNIGEYRDISITVSDGTNTARLGPFDIEVAAGGNGAVTLSWTIPTQNTDGSALTDLSAFRVGWQRTGSAAQGSININNASVSSYVVENLAAGTYDFTIVAINSVGIASAPSNTTRATIN